MVIVAALGVLGLWQLERNMQLIPSTTGRMLAREIGLAVAAFGVIQVAVLFVFQTVLARRKIPRILNEFVFALALIGYVVYRMSAVGVNFAGLVTTSAVLGALAFSAQQTLNNLWGGISLQLEKTCRIGDWVRIDTMIGEVVSIRWRYMAIATITNETVVIPNGSLMQNRVTVIARRGEEHVTWRRTVSFQVEYDHPPSRVIAQVERALERAQIAHVSQNPRPRVVCSTFNDSGIEYTVIYDLMRLSEYLIVDSQIRVHVYAALMRQGMGIPFPRRIVEMRQDERQDNVQRQVELRVAALRTMDLFASLTDGERMALAREMGTSAYVHDEVIFRAGEPADSLYLLAQGRVDIVRDDAQGARIRRAALEAPAYFGDMGLLLGQPRAATVVAADDALCYRLDKKGFDAIIRARPELAELLAHVLADRQAANDATLQALDAEARARQSVGRTKELMRKIQQFFGISKASSAGATSTTR
jgi:small-conductance mechanosensitive channel/CRP-like cAMP-binding protein